MGKLNMISAILKFINGRNKSREDLEDIINYTTDPAKTEGGNLVSTLGCSRSDPLRDIENNKMAWHKEGKQYEHFVLAFPPNGNQHSAKEILRITSQIVDTVYPDFMAVISVHTDSLILHSHVVLDALNAVTGKKFSQGPGDLNRVKQKTNSILKAHGFEIIQASANDFVDHTDYSHVKGFGFLELDESAFITEQDLKAVGFDDEVINDRFYDEIGDGCMWPESYHSYPEGGYTMSTITQETFNAPQPVEETELTLTEQAVPTTPCSPANAFPNTTVVTGPTFHIRGSNRSDFFGLGDHVTSTVAQAQEHEREAASLALAMQTKAQETGHPTNVAVIAGPVFDIDLTAQNRYYGPFIGDDGEEYD